jgi:hypothetical protein
MKPAETGKLSEQAVREQLDRLTRSDALKRSRRLQQFLRYVTELTLAGEESTINEYLLGVEVFERGPHYNAADDSIVRRQAHALRHKLADYYATEGKQDPIRIEIPLGHYVPIFQPNEEAEESDAVAAPPASQSKPAASHMAAVAVFGILGLGLAFWLGQEFGSSRSSADIRGGSAPASSAVRELWQPWLDADQAPLIVFSSPMTAVVKQYALPLPPGSNPPRLAVPEGLDQAFRERLGLGQDGYLYLSPTIGETKSGESLGAVQLANLFAANGMPIRATTAALLTWEDFRQRNLILFGHNEQNPWMDPLLEGYPLQLQATSGELQRRIVNAKPEAGEPEYYQIDYPSKGSESTIEYALVSMLPGTDGLHELLLVSGLNTQATLMAIEFLTNEDRAAQLVDDLRRQTPGHAGPWHFQLVLRAEVREGVPTGAAIELTRVLGGRPISRVLR